MKKKDYVLSEEVAQAQWADFTDYYEMDTEECSDLVKTIHKSMIDAIRLGRLEVIRGEGGVMNLKQTLRSGEILTWAELQGKHKLAIDAHGDGKNYGRMFSLAGALTGVGEAGIIKLRGVDLSLVESIGTIFLQV